MQELTSPVLLNDDASLTLGKNPDVSYIYVCIKVSSVFICEGVKMNFFANFSTTMCSMYHFYIYWNIKPGGLVFMASGETTFALLCPLTKCKFRFF